MAEKLKDLVRIYQNKGKENTFYAKILSAEYLTLKVTI